MNNFFKKNKRSLLIMLLFAVLMFGFGFALVPLYNVFCSVTGLNGKTSNNAVAAVDDSQADMTRTIRMQFLSTINGKLNWIFRPPKKQTITIHPGKNYRINFFAKNKTNHRMIVQAIPSVTPGLAAKYLKKTECFCFTQQALAGGKTMDMPLLFHIDPAIPKDIEVITLSYTLFDASKFAIKNPHEN